MERKQKTSSLFPLLFAVFLSMFGVGIIAPIIPVYAETLGAGGFMIGVIFSIFSASRALVMLFYGRVSDIKGRKIFITTGLAAYCILSLLYTYAHSVLSLTFVRLFHGLSSAAILPIVMAYIGDITPKGSEGKYMGIYTTALFLGFGSGPLAGGIIKDGFGIKAPFYAMGSLVFLGLLLVIFFVKEPHRRHKPTHIYPLRKMMGSRRILSIATFRFSSAIGRSIIFTFLPVYAYTKLSLPAWQIGLTISIMVLFTSLLQTPSGYLADKLSKTILTATGAIINTVCLLALAWSHNLMSIIIITIVMGLGGAISVPSITALAVNEGRQMGMGSVMGIFNFSMSGGQTVGPVIAGVLMDISGITAPFIFASVALIGGTLSFVTGMKKPKTARI